MTVAPATTIVEGARLLGRHGGVVEVRILKTAKGTVSGYFDDLEELAKAVKPWDGKASIYITANPVEPALLARASNRLREFARETTADREILRRVWFLLDLDPKRPAGISATDAEVAAALERRNEIVAFLGELGFDDPATCMSGNGGHANWAVDLPNDEATTRLFERALKALKAKFSDNIVSLDEAVFNAARIWKLYGTVAVKGDATADRPRRRAMIERNPEPLLTVPRELLEELAAMAPTAPTFSIVGSGSGMLAPIDLIATFRERGWYGRPLRDGKHAVTCPWSVEHSADSGLTETCLFEPRGVGQPWGFDCRHAHCSGRTIRDVLAVLMPTKGHYHPVVTTIDLARAPAAAPAPYTFTPAVPAGHFLADYIAYGAARTDAAHEMHEAAGLTLLGAATPGVRAILPPYPGGLATNLYVLIVAESTLSRKSTTKAIARDVHDAVIPSGALADLTSPEALIEQLAKRSGDTAMWDVDEIGDLLDKMHHAKHMAGLRGLLLTVYDGRDYRYSRHSKRTKGGGTVEDEDCIRQPHLCVIGATTPGVFDLLTSGDVRSGLLPRFAVVMPTTKPPRRPFYGNAEGWDESRRNPLTTALHRLYAWSRSARRSVTFAPGTLEALDEFAAGIEREAAEVEEAARTMLHRLAPMALKVAMLVAAGHPTTPDRDGLYVTESDAAAAVAIATRWRTDAIRFAARIGETEFERLVERCLRVFRTKAPRVPRRVIAQGVHLSKRALDDVEATLVDRGAIQVGRLETPGRPTLVLWETPGA